MSSLSPSKIEFKVKHCLDFCQISSLKCIHRLTWKGIWCKKKLRSHARSIPWYCSKVWRLRFYMNEAIVSGFVLFNIKSQRAFKCIIFWTCSPFQANTQEIEQSHWYKTNHFGEGQSNPATNYQLLAQSFELIKKFILL